MKIIIFFLLLIPVLGYPQINTNLKLNLEHDYCYYIDMYLFAQDSQGQFLGVLSSNKYDSESIINTFGQYGSTYSSTSILNKYCDYGSEYSSLSAYNKFASNPPIICKLENGVYTPLAFLTKNTLKEPALDPDILITLLKNDCDTSAASEPDILAFSLWISEKDYCIGDSIEINYTIFNNSRSDFNSLFYTSLSLDTSLITSFKTTKLASKTSIHGSARVKLSSNTHRIILITDYTSLVPESNEANNRTSLIIHPKIPTTGIEQKLVGETLSIYPNPVYSNGFLKIDSDTFFSRITMYSFNGQLILDKPIENNIIDISTENINKGLYLIKLYNRQGYVVKKIIIS